jgi:hypothetical protein
MTTRYRVKTSATMRQKRMIPWIIAGTRTAGSRGPARINAPNRIDATTTRHGPRCAEVGDDDRGEPVPGEMRSWRRWTDPRLRSSGQPGERARDREDDDDIAPDIDPA